MQVRFVKTEAGVIGLGRVRGKDQISVMKGATCGVYV